MSGGQALAFGGPVGNAERANILLVDDRPANLLALEAVLGDLGGNLVRAGSGEEALRRLEAEDFAAVLLDVQMPGMTGFEVARVVRARPRSKYTPVIFLSAYEDPAFPVERAYALGAVDYLLKPFAPEVLRAKVAFFVDYWRTHAALTRAQERRVEESEAWVRTVTDSLPALVSYVDRDQRYRFVNKAYEEWFGRPTGEVVGMTVADLVGSEVHDQRRAYLEAALRGEPQRFEGPTRHHTRGLIAAEMTYTPHVVAGEVRGVFVLVSDVTARRRGEEALRASEARFRFLDALGEAARKDARPGDVMATTTRLLGEHLGVTRCAYAHVEADNDRFTIRHDWTAPGVETTVGDYSLDLFGPRAAADMRAGRTLVVRDVDRELPPEGGASMFSAIGIQAIVCCPLVKAGRLRAMMAVHHATPRDWTDAEVALVEAVVERSWAHIERAKSEAEANAEREKLSAVIGGMSQGVVLLNADGTLSHMNKAALAMHGLTDEAEMLRRISDFADLFEITDRDGRFVPWTDWPASKAVRGETVTNFELHVRRRDTGNVFVGLYSSALVRQNGGVKWAVLAINDVTDRVRAQQALAESEARFRQLAETIPQLAWMARPDGHIFWYNRRWYEYTGTTPAQMEGWGWREVHDPEVLPTVVERWERSLSTGAPFDMVFPLKGNDGAFRPFLTRVAPLRDESGGVTLWFGTNTDISEQKRAEEVLREADRRKGQFIAMLAHELRNPLAPIRNAVALLGMRQDAETVARVREVVGRQAEHLAHVVNDLLEVSRLSSGKVRIRRERVDLGQIVRAGAEDLAPAFGDANVALNVNLPETPVWVEGDRTRLAQVVDNLLTNSLKFTEQGRVEVTLRGDAERALLAVADTGIGIPPDVLPRLFEPFSQADESLDRTRGGLGLGLAVVRGLVDLHGGSVAAESPGSDQGSTFTITLPALAELPALATGLPPQTPPTVERRRVLIIEDNRDAADTLKLLLELCGCEVTVAYTGPDGLAAGLGAGPDLVLCDIGLPGMNGYEVARRLKAGLSGAKPMLVALTGYGEEEDRRRAMDAGFDRHFTKPVDPEFIRRLLAKVH